MSRWRRRGPLTIWSGGSFHNGAARYNGPANGITLNYKYFLDGLAALETPKARLRVIDAMNPCVLMADGEDTGERLTYIVMPIKQ